MADFASKKVFFVCPPSIVQQEMLLLLINMEYEIYLLKEPEHTRRALKLWPDSVFFFNIDDKLSRENWDKLILDLQARSKDSPCLFGIISYEHSPELAQHYLMELNLPCGYIQLNQKLKECTAILSRTLEANEARGRRKFIRYEIPPERYQRINFNLNGKIYHGELQDISSAAMVVVMDDGTPSLDKGVEISDIQLNLAGRRIKAAGIVFGNRQAGQVEQLIISFSNTMNIRDVSDIRFFIHSSLQRNLEEQMGIS